VITSLNATIIVAMRGMLKKAASGVLAVLPTFGLTDVPLFAAFALTYAAYAPRVKTAAALLDGLF